MVVYRISANTRKGQNMLGLKKNVSKKTTENDVASVTGGAVLT